MVKHHIYKRGVLMCASLFFGLVATAQVFRVSGFFRLVTPYVRNKVLPACT